MSEDLTSLNLVELYDRLVMPEPPVSVSMWPQTVGWIWLGLALVLLAALTVWRITAWRRATAYRRAALRALRAAGDDPVAIAMVLRRTALSGFPRDSVAGLQGSEWLEFLDQTSVVARFDGSSAGAVLIKAPYKPQPPHKDLHGMAETWIRTHRGQGAGP